MAKHPFCIGRDSDCLCEECTERLLAEHRIYSDEWSLFERGRQRVRDYEKRMKAMG